jgi:hypothetical protein
VVSFKGFNVRRHYRNLHKDKFDLLEEKLREDETNETEMSFAATAKHIQRCN